MTIKTKSSSEEESSEEENDDKEDSEKKKNLQKNKVGILQVTTINQLVSSDILIIAQKDSAIVSRR